MSSDFFPSLEGKAWAQTRTALHDYARVLGAYRKTLSPRRKHWWHISLRPTLTGLNTGPLWSDGEWFSLELDLRRPGVIMRNGEGERQRVNIRGESGLDLQMAIDERRLEWGLEITLEDDSIGDAPHQVDADQSSQLHVSLLSFSGCLDRFRSTLSQETSPIQVWPHHFDLAMLVLTGGTVEGADPEDETRYDEQLNFGFSPGDEHIAQPYVYVTRYPEPERLAQAQMLDGAAWHDGGWQGIAVPWMVLTETDHPMDWLVEQFRQAIEAGL